MNKFITLLAAFLSAAAVHSAPVPGQNVGVNEGTGREGQAVGAIVGSTGNIVAGKSDAVGGLLKTEAGVVVVVGNLKERSVTDGVGTAVDGVLEPLLPIVDAGGQAVGEIVGATGNIVDGAVDAVDDLFDGVGGAVLGNLKKRGVTDGLGTAVDGVVAPLVPIVDTTGQAVDEIVGATGNIVSGTVGAVGELLDGVTGTVLGNL